MPKPKQKFQWTFSKIIAIAALVVVIGVLVYALIAARTNGGENGNNKSIPPSGQKITVEGEYVCLPKPGDGPQTLECAFGIKTDDNVYYGLDFASTGLGPEAFKAGERTRISGEFEEKETIYISEGTITVESFEEL